MSKFIKKGSTCYSVFNNLTNKLFMGICFLQHRIVTGINSNINICKLSKSCPTLSNLGCGWMQYPKPILITIFSILYTYIILLTLAMTVDMGHMRICGGISKKVAIYPHFSSLLSMLRCEFNQIFLAVLTFLYKRRLGIIKKYLNSYWIVSPYKLVKLNTSLISKLGCFFSYWLMAMNLMLIVVCYPSILNPGPTITGIFQNDRGFVPFSGLGEPVPPLDINKVQEFQCYLFNKNPGIVVLNETWLSNDHFDNEIFPNQPYKVFRMDRSVKSHPPDPSNPRKFRRNGGGILVAIRSDLNVQSKCVGSVCKAEIMSI